MQHGKPFVLFDVSPKRQDLLAIKHALDIISAFVFLIIFLPFLVLIAFFVLVTVGRPVFFLQTRAGRFGREFRMIKFRTMKLDAEKQREELLHANEMDGPVFKVTNDPRVTWPGTLLRRWSIDELPQLINVISGTMSMVGPRPLPVDEQKKIRGWKRRRLSMKPGISGLWQVSGRNDVDFEKWMKLDLQYVDNWSLKNDFLILLKTASAVIRGRGAK
jgi:lipopolysaccharide/colanic/teichoic acid biosynthesis glycosyltransferase